MSFLKLPFKFSCKAMLKFNTLKQPAKKVVSNSPGLVDFAIGLVIFVLNLPDR